MREQGSIKRMGMGLCRHKMVGMKSRSKGRQGEGCIGATGTRRGATVAHMGDGKPREIH